MFKDQVVWITGASSGIGEAVAIEMAGEGAKLVLSARREDELNRVAEAARAAGAGEVMVLPLDVTRLESFDGAVDAVLGKFSHIDMLLNNAGVAQTALIVKTQMDAYRKIFEINFFGQVALTKKVLPHMLKRKSGHIAVTSSVSGQIGTPERAGYTAVKHAVMGWFDTLRLEVFQHDMQVTTITPGYIATNISEFAHNGEGVAFGRSSTNNDNGMKVDACAVAIMKGFKRGKRDIAVGTGIEMWAMTIKYWWPSLLFKLTEKRCRRWDVE